MFTIKKITTVEGVPIYHRDTDTDKPSTNTRDSTKVETVRTMQLNTERRDGHD